MQTENILKFLSYAGPRIDYLEKRATASMEKQALSPKVLRSAYEAASKLPADRQARLKNIMSLKFDGKTPVPVPKASSPIGSWWNNIMTAHPIAAPTAAAGATGAVTGGLGYGIGNANGKDDGAKMAQHYIMMQNLMEQLRAQKNKGFFSSLFS